MHCSCNEELNHPFSVSDCNKFMVLTNEANEATAVVDSCPRSKVNYSHWGSGVELPFG